MLQKFLGKKRVPCVPAAWLNAVATWLNGLHSKTNTITIGNINSAENGGVPSVDINPEQAARHMRSALSVNFVCKSDKTLLGEGLKWSDKGLTIDKEWLEKQFVQMQKA